MNDTVTRLLEMADEYRNAISPDRVAKCAKELQDELTRLFTPLSDERLMSLWLPHGVEFARAVEAAHGIGETK